jgi:hypothetical protein
MTIGGSLASGTYQALPAAAALATMAATMVVILNQAKKDEVDRSKFYLESALKGFEQAIDMLTDTNNRVRWIAGARMLASSREVANSVTEPEHLRVLEISMLDVRHQLSNILRRPDEGSGGSFFYGGPPDVAEIDVAARLSTQRVRMGGEHVSQLTDIPEDALYTVWKFALFPENYQDPMVRGRFTGRTWLFLQYTFPSLYAYLSHKDRWHSASGEFHRNTSPPDRSREQED